MSVIAADTIKTRVVGAAVTTTKGLNVGGACTSTSFVGPLTGAVTGNADTATTLATARDIGGVSFNGSASINLPGVNQSGTQNTSGTAANLSGTPDITIRNVTGVAATFTGVLTYEDVTNVDSVGIVTARGGLEVGAAGVGGTISSGGNVIFAGITTVGTALSLPDNVRAKFGTGGDLSIYHNGSNSFIDDQGTGALQVLSNEFYVANAANTQTMLRGDEGAGVKLYFAGSEKIKTHNTGIRVTGIATVTSTIYVNVNGSSIAENNLNFASSGKAYIDHRTTSQDIDFRVSHGSALDRTAITIGSAGVSTFYDTPHDDLGYMRNVPLNTQGSTYTLVDADSGKTILASDTITITDGVFEAGDVVTIINNTGGNITINKGSVLYWTNDGTSANRTLATRGMASIYFTHNTTGYIGGAGLS